MDLPCKQGQNFPRVLAIFSVATDVTPYLEGVTAGSHLVGLLSEVGIVVGYQNRDSPAGSLLCQLGEMLLFIEIEAARAVTGEVG